MINLIAIGLSCLVLSAGHAPFEGGELGPGPGAGWGFPNGNPDGYGFWSQGHKLAICQGRTTEFYVQRYMMLPSCQLLFPQYFNPYVMRSQRYIPYTGCVGGCHPFSDPIIPTTLSMKPYDEGPVSTQPVVNMPRFVGVTESEPINSGSSGFLP